MLYTSSVSLAELMHEETKKSRTIAAKTLLYDVYFIIVCLMFLFSGDKFITFLRTILPKISHSVIGMGDEMMLGYSGWFVDLHQSLYYLRR